MAKRAKRVTSKKSGGSCHIKATSKLCNYRSFFKSAARQCKGGSHNQYISCMRSVLKGG